MNATPHLLIVDDDSEICTLLSSFLAQYGYRVSLATSGGAMMQTLASANIDLVVLDIMLPGKDGLALCRELRASGRLPIIMLTAIDGEADRVVGLEMGADDYLTKPFSPRELVARIRAVLRRAAGPGPGAPPGTVRSMSSPAGASTWRGASFSRQPVRWSCCALPSSTFFSPWSSGPNAP